MSDATGPMTGSDGPGPDDRALAAEYVLGLLAPSEADAFETRLTHEPALRDELALWQGYLTAMTAQVPETVPPVRVKRRVETALFGAPQAGATTAGARGGWLARLTGRRALGAMSLAAAAGIAALVVMTPQTRGPQAPLDPGYAAELVSENSGYLFSAAWSPDQQAVAVTRLEGAPPRPGGGALAHRAGRRAGVAGAAGPVGAIGHHGARTAGRTDGGCRSGGVGRAAGRGAGCGANGRGAGRRTGAGDLTARARFSQQGF